MSDGYYEVTWIDSAQCDGWHGKSDLPTIQRIVSVGKIIHATEDEIVLSSHQGETGNLCDIAIPRVAIVSQEAVALPVYDPRVIINPESPYYKEAGDV
jgi:hypothetical protein